MRAPLPCEMAAVSDTEKARATAWASDRKSHFHGAPAGLAPTPAPVPLPLPPYPCARFRCAPADAVGFGAVGRRQVSAQWPVDTHICPEGSGGRGCARGKKARRGKRGVSHAGRRRAATFTLTVVRDRAGGNINTCSSCCTAFSEPPRSALLSAALGALDRDVTAAGSLHRAHNSRASG